LLQNGLRDLLGAVGAISYAWRHPLVAAAILAALTSLVVFIFWIVDAGGTGFVKQIPEQTGRRTLWDWFGLLLIPTVLGLSGFVINLLLQRRTSSEMQTDREIALDRTREESLHHYLDTMQELVLQRGLKHGADESL
jgi:hypothetical protein